MLLVERKDDLLDCALPSVHQVIYSLTDLAYIYIFYSTIESFILGLGQTSNLSRVEFIKNRFDKEST